MFNDIAGRYDLLNRILSAGADRHWRRRAAALAAQGSPRTALDAATGTADLAIAMARQGIPQITGIDISQKMIDIGQTKLRTPHLARAIRLQCADGERLPFADQSFDAAAMAFGIRNYQDRRRGFAEIVRVLRPQGRFVMIEFSMPSRAPMKWLYGFYFCKILPCIGKIVSRHNAAYRYLPQSVREFPAPDALCAEMREAGFECASAQPLTWGIVHLYNAAKR